MFVDTVEVILLTLLYLRLFERNRNRVKRLYGYAMGRINKIKLISFRRKPQQIQKFTPPLIHPHLIKPFLRKLLKEKPFSVFRCLPCFLTRKRLSGKSFPESRLGTSLHYHPIGFILRCSSASVFSSSHRANFSCEKFGQKFCSLYNDPQKSACPQEWAKYEGFETENQIIMQFSLLLTPEGRYTAGKTSILRQVKTQTPIQPAC